jgi:hypothetical protein
VPITRQSSGLADDVREIVGVLARHEHPVLLGEILRPGPAQRLEAVSRLVEDPGQPLRARLDEAPAELRKDLGDLAQQNVAEGGDRGDAEAVERGRDRDRVAVEVVQPGVAVGDVNRDRHIEAARLVVDRVEVGVGEQAVALDRPQQHGAGAVLLGEADLIEGVRDARGRHDAGPAQPSLAVAIDIGEPAVPALAERHLHGNALGHGLDEDRVVEDLNVDPDPIHVLETEIDVAQLARLPRFGELPAHLPLAPLELLAGKDREAKAPDLAVDEPELESRARLFGRLERDRAVFPLGRVHVVPRAGRLDDVGVGIDDRSPGEVFHRGTSWVFRSPLIIFRFAREGRLRGANVATLFRSSAPPLLTGAA